MFPMYQKIFTSKEEVLFMNTNYNSVYGLHIKQFIETKRKFGFKFKTPASILGQIDRLAAKRTETSAGITKEFAQTWGINNYVNLIFINIPEWVFLHNFLPICVIRELYHIYLNFHLLLNALSFHTFFLRPR